ncbi:hypothetical protein KR009_009035, partial [Drosophila setifemur]
AVHPLVQVPNQLVGAPVLTDVTLICNVEASPKAINYWQRENGEMIIAGDRYALTEKENNMYAIEMILHIKRLQSSDFGGYKCISKNSIGDTEGTIRLYEMERPGKKHSRLDEDDNEVTKQEAGLKDNRHEDGSRNQNGRLYKERHPEHPATSQGHRGPRTLALAQNQGTMRLIGTFLLALLVLLTALAKTTTTTATTTSARTQIARATISCQTMAGRQKEQKEPNEASFSGDSKDTNTKADAKDADAERSWGSWERSTSWRRAFTA